MLKLLQKFTVFRGKYDIFVYKLIILELCKLKLFYLFIEVSHLLF